MGDVASQATWHSELAEFDRRLAAVDTLPAERREDELRELAREWLPILRQMSREAIADAARRRSELRRRSRVRGIFIGVGY